MQRKSYQYISNLSEGIKGYHGLPQPVWDDEYIEALEVKLRELGSQGYEIISPTLAERNWHVKYDYDVFVDVPSYFRNAPTDSFDKRKQHYQSIEDHIKYLGEHYWSLVYEHHGLFKELGDVENPQPAVLYVFKSPDMAAPLPIEATDHEPFEGLPIF